MDSKQILYHRIKRELRKKGFPLVSATGAGPFHDLENRLENMSKEGLSFKFQSPEIEEKTNPRKSMNDCQSIIVVGMPYYQKDDDNPPELWNPPVGRLSLSSRGEDYHIVMKRKMNEVMEMLNRDIPGLSYQCHVDTGPLIDRYLAYKAGLGNYGYNNQLINETLGSYIFLGYIMINQDFSQSDDHHKGEKFRPSCAGCEACIKACPTGALEEPYRLNPDKCLSGILQTKGMIPDKYRPLIEDRLYGCDECQKVCPYNQGLEIEIDSAFRKEPQNAVDLEKLLGYTNKEFKEALGHNASSWRGAGILKRNGLIILGNLKDSAALPLILPFLKDSREDLRVSAEWAREEIEKFKLLKE